MGKSHWPEAGVRKLLITLSSLIEDQKEAFKIILKYTLHSEKCV